MLTDDDPRSDCFNAQAISRHREPENRSWARAAVIQLRFLG